MLHLFVLALGLAVVAPHFAIAQKEQPESTPAVIETVHIDMLDARKSFNVLANQRVQFKLYKGLPAPPCSAPDCPVTEEKNNPRDKSDLSEGGAE